MSILERFPALIFDFDGTLIDSAPDIALGLNRLLVAEGRRELPLSDVHQMIGDGAGRLVEQAFAATGAALTPAELGPMTERYLAIYGALPVDRSCIYPGVVETLTALKNAGHRLGLCTNKPAGISVDLLRDLGLDALFDAVAGGDSVARKKPHPDPLLFVMERLGVGAGGAVMVGDNANDVAAARGAGVPVVAVAYGYPRMALADLGADIIIDRFADLPGALARLG
ncbi:phosphoglycolate phosphatase [Niveispirillum cyanobacteriorum]|uniref:Phosphoglycolate phosphatase n=1 Tax=Niveispirillum cyanobacteriorum TaxID=1612173 RepID=A0A2K9N7J7_9PROT|nr:phosphoglycolate phosphatase [Niveispirillum cyanobacteriorum]AUN29118.1 phosphoglycolate phosphatase [Niveispirillum cyanobacteriorum]GGE67362.1 phosphoglycolate phosphatase [Niveispirillum cyanobacteriorum]